MSGTGSHVLEFVRANPLLGGGVAGLAATMLFTITLGPNAPSRIEARIGEAVITALSETGAGHVSAIIHGQRVDLQGVTPSLEERDRVVRAVLGAAGPGGLVSGGVSKVTTAKLDFAPPAIPYRFVATIGEEGVEMSGAAPSRSAVAAIERAAGLLFSQPAQSSINLAYGPPEGVNWEIGVIQGLEALSRLREGRMELTGARLYVSGVAPSDAIASDIASQLMLAGGGIVTETNVRGPAEWVATLANGAIILEGRAGSQAAAEALAAAVDGAFEGMVNNHMEVGAVGGWQARALLALRHLAQFRTGVLRVQSSAFHITGEAPASVLAFLREDMEQLPDDGYSVVWSVTEIAPDIPEITGIELSGRAGCERAFAAVMAGNEILFDTGGASISRDSGATLDKLATVAQSCGGFRIEVQGHTDNRGSRAANLRLSRQRADAVRNWLVARGLPADAITAAGFGPDRPAASNRTEGGRAQNRRIEFRVTEMERR